MVIAARHLADDERVVAFTRTHAKALTLPTLILFTTCALTGFLLAAAVTRVGPVLAWLVLAAAVLVGCYFTVRPFLRWLSTTYTVTNRRILVRSGILRRVGSEVHLSHLAGVRFTRGLLDRLFGSGTLLLSETGDNGGFVVLADVPHVRALQLVIADQMYAYRNDGWSRSAGAPPPTAHLPERVNRG